MHHCIPKIQIQLVGMLKDLGCTIRKKERQETDVVPLTYCVRYYEDKTCGNSNSQMVSCLLFTGLLLKRTLNSMLSVDFIVDWLPKSPEISQCMDEGAFVKLDG